MNVPRFKGIIKVKPVQTGETGMHPDPEVERIGMQVVMEHEKKHGRTPEDVSEQNLGFDIRSKDTKTEQVRYIEVKARAKTGPVALTQNEWFKAKRFGDDYYLYAVMEISTRPQLYIIQNPALNLEAEEKIAAVRYYVPFNEIKTKGETAGCTVSNASLKNHSR